MKVTLTNIQRIKKGELPGLHIEPETPFEKQLLHDFAYGGFCNNGTKVDLYANWDIEELGITVGFSSEELQDYQSYEEAKKLGCDCK